MLLITFFLCHCKNILVTLVTIHFENISYVFILIVIYLCNIFCFWVAQYEIKIIIPF